ncbi:hypothetical protein FACS18949_15970 [Clostridia bacterium]|nr:hypothetical protein FACS18949_15970 [Clostridia bacterium]
MLFTAPPQKTKFDLALNPCFKFGIIRDKAIVAYVTNHSIEYFMSENGLFILNIVRIQDVLAFRVDSTIERLKEFNPTLNMLSEEGGFWVTDETEYKIEVGNDINVLDGVANREISDYSFSDLCEFANYERYVKCYNDQQCIYISILGKKNYKRAMGMKCKTKKDAPILTRHVEILPYSLDSFNEYMQTKLSMPYSSINQLHLPAYYKKKRRLICLDRKQGLVYGISNTISRPLTLKISEFHEVEIEYWSRLVYGNQEVTSADFPYDLSRFNDLINLVLSNINGVKHHPGRTKIEWLECGICG